MISYLLISFLTIVQPQSDMRQFLYAEHLFDQRAYRSAILEYKRLLFYHPDMARADLVRYRIGLSYYHQGNRNLARQKFEEVTQIFPNSPLNLQAQLMLGRTYFDAKNYSTARSTFFSVVSADGGGETAAQARYLRAWCYIHEQAWFKAIAEFRTIQRLQPNTPLSQVSTQLADITYANTPLPFKSPQLAQWMSTFLPGAGQIYAGKLESGLISGAVNAAVCYLLVDSILDERYVDAVGICLVGSRFYLRNRVNAGKRAIEHNQRLEADFIRQLKQQVLDNTPPDFQPRLPS
ncbi:tetratricopeptide repeat protein [Candidatus Poribacteria bacterium]|nr:tetratricopeptide repeat protein [Candidatus Poribacteria bacterium]